jgi:hypothetical protein
MLKKILKKYNADPDPAFDVNTGPDQGSQINADPDPGQTLPLQKVVSSHEK